MSDEKRDPPMPKASPSPQYDEKVHVEKLKADTGTWDMSTVVHELKRQTRLRLRRWIAAGGIALTGSGVGGGGILSCQGEKARAERAEQRAKRAEAIEARFKEIEARLSGCCGVQSRP